MDVLLQVSPKLSLLLMISEHETKQLVRDQTKMNILLLGQVTINLALVGFFR